MKIPMLYWRPATKGQACLEFVRLCRIVSSEGPTPNVALEFQPNPLRAPGLLHLRRLTSSPSAVANVFTRWFRLHGTKHKGTRTGSKEPSRFHKGNHG